MTALAAFLTVALAAIAGLVTKLLQMRRKAKEAEAQLARSAEQLAEVQRRAAERALAKAEGEERMRVRERQARMEIHEIEGRTYSALRREPATPEDAENEAKDIFDEAERTEIADAFGAGGPPPPEEGSKP